MPYFTSKASQSNDSDGDSEVLSNEHESPVKSVKVTSEAHEIQRAPGSDEEDRIQIKPVNDEDDTSVMITFNQSISPFIIILTFCRVHFRVSVRLRHGLHIQCSNFDRHRFGQQGAHLW